MGGFSIWHWIIVGAWIALIGIPATKILGRLGFSKWWALLAIFPWLNILGIWLLAFTRWPRDTGDKG